MPSVWSQSVAVRANTPEGTRRVVTPECTLVAQFQALVHILAHLVHPRGETLVTNAFETAVNIAARSVPAYILLNQAFVIVYTASAARV